MSPPRTTTLTDLINRAMERHGVTSSRALEKIGKGAGLQISHTTLSQIRKATYSPTPERITLEAIAHLAGVPYREVLKAASLSVVGRPFHEEFGPEYDVLPVDQREVVKTVARALLKANRQRDGETDRVHERSNHQHDGVAHATDEDLEGPDELTLSG